MRGSEINTSEEDAMRMNSDQLDEYMDYYERTFIDRERAEQKTRGLPKQLLDMFPTNRLDGSEPFPYSYHLQVEREQLATQQTLETVMGSLKIRPVMPADRDDGEGVHRVGSFYKRYRHVEDLDGVAKLFYDRVAERVGLSIETLVLAVLQVEQMLIKWRERKAKEDQVEGDVEMSNAKDDSDEVDDEELYSD